MVSLFSYLSLTRREYRLFPSPLLFNKTLSSLSLVRSSALSLLALMPLPSKL